MEAKAQANSRSQRRGLTYSETKQSNSKNDFHPNTMAYATESGISPPSAKDAIARSMSRYKRNRQVMTTNGSAPPLPVPSSNRAEISQVQKTSVPKPIREVSSNNRSKETANFDPKNREFRTATQSGKGAVPNTVEPELRPLPESARSARHSRRESIEQKGLERGATIHSQAKHHSQRRNGESQPNGSGNPGSTPMHQDKTFERTSGHATRPLQGTLTLKSPLKKTFAERMSDRIGKYHSSKTDARADLKKAISTPVAIGLGAEIVVPSFDAPISAVNAGERRVIVKFRDYLISLPVTPSTTPLDIIRATAAEKLELVDTTAFTLLELFKQVGLERPLRKYEHIRDVLNSWDNDAQNMLVIVPSPTGGHDDELDVRSVTKDQPSDTSVYMYYSQKPGHWDKRWITLRSDGQMVVKKGSETTNICHLSDFDIYAPTQRQLAKKIKPPKKLCFAVKSQQKSSMFLSTVNFVHFFSTNDKELAASWYKAVQQWRSWYLVNTMGKTQKAAEAAEVKNTKDIPGSHVIEHSGLEPASMEPKTNRPHVSPIKTAVYHIDSSEPELALQRSPTVSTPQQPRSNEFSNFPRSHKEINEVSSKPDPNRNRSAPPISYPKKLTKDAVSGTGTNNGHNPSFVQSNTARSDPEPFATNSLLGRTYSQRQKALANRQKDSGPPMSQSPTATTSHTSEEGGGFLKRASSQRQKPKPLVDLTPQYQEPPQHTRKGRGVTVAQVPAGGLIDIATSPEIAISIPPTTAWRRTDLGTAENSPKRPTTARTVL